MLNVDTTRYAPLSPWFAHAIADHCAEHGDTNALVDENMLRRGVLGSAQRLSERFTGHPAGLRLYRRDIVRRARALQPELTIVVAGFFVDRATVDRVREVSGGPVVCVLTDSPFNPRVQARFMLEALTSYDIVFSTKRRILDELRSHGCRRVEHLEFAYEPALHFPEPPSTDDEHARFDCDIAFIGSYEPARARSLLRLREAHPEWKVKAFGGGWSSHRDLESLGLSIGGHAVGRDYRLAASGARIALSHPRWDNADTTSMRTFELPAIGAFLLAEYSDDQAAILRPGVEAAYFRDDDDLIAQAERYLGDDVERSAIARAGRRAIVETGNRYHDRLDQIVGAVNAANRR
ncbi:MAG: glycosyltransferase [Acidimicrobiia bacterium]